MNQQFNVAVRKRTGDKNKKFQSFIIDAVDISHALNVAYILTFELSNNTDYCIEVKPLVKINKKGK